MCFGSVYAWNTSSRGASKTRVSVSVRPRISVVVAAPPRPSKAASLSRLWPSPSLVGPLIASRSSTVSKRCVMVSFVLAPCASNTTAMSTSGGMCCGPSPSNVNTSRSLGTTSRKTPLPGKTLPSGPRMLIRMAPPGRTSSSQTGAVKSFGGNHCAICFGSVHALNTRSRGASNTRVVTSSRSLAGSDILASGVVATSLLLRVFGLSRVGAGLLLKLAEVAVEAVEALLPEAPIALDPVGDLPQALGLEPAGPPLRVAAPGDQAGGLEHLEALRGPGEAPGGRVRELGDRRPARRQTGQDRPPPWVGDRGEPRTQRGGRHPYCTFRLNNWMV